MSSLRRGLTIGLLLALTVLVAGASGDCSFGGSSDCLFFCS